MRPIVKNGITMNILNCQWQFQKTPKRIAIYYKSKVFFASFFLYALAFVHILVDNLVWLGVQLNFLLDAKNYSDSLSTVPVSVYAHRTTEQIFDRGIHTLKDAVVHGSQNYH